MSETQEFVVEERPRAGRGASRAVRRRGLVPGVVYGGDKPEVLVAIEPGVLRREMARGGFFARVCQLRVSGGGSERVLPREIQVHPVSDEPVHVDFMRVSPRTRIRTMVDVHFLNEATSPGLRAGGVLNVVRHQVELHGPVQAMPDQLELDLADCQVGEVLKISRVRLPAGIAPVISDRDFTIATIAAPRTEEVAETDGGQDDASD